VRSRRRELAAVAVAAVVAALWLNQSVGLKDWEAEQAAAKSSALEAARLPIMFLYRRALDEEMYFATASAILGQPYDRSIFGMRGASPLPPIDVPADGRFHMPYADVAFEYPPPNLPFVLVPRLFARTFGGYSRLFGAIMGALLVSGAWLASRIGASDPRERAARLAGFAALLLAHGAIAIQRLDALVALLLVVVAMYARRGDDGRAGFWAGVAGATKIVPAFACVAMILASGAGSRPNKRRLGRFAAGGAVGLVLALGPMAVLSPDSLRMIAAYHGARGLHVESSLGVIYGALKAVLGLREAGILDYGSFNFHGTLADALAKAATLLTLGLVGWVCVLAWRGGLAQNREREGEHVVLAGLAATVALWLGGKVFSPQYLTWAIPLAIAAPRWKKIALVYGVVLVLSQLYYRGFYDYVYGQKWLGIATMTVRLGVLVALFVVLLRALRRPDVESAA
jgi:hypothetical protein